MTKIYFVRHAKPDFNEHNDEIRPLTEEGMKASLNVTEKLKDKNIGRAYSSPYKRSVDTIRDLCETLKLEINPVHNLRERKVGDEWINNFTEYSINQWNDFNYKLENGECLKEVQERNIEALEEILRECNEESIVIGTHGTALSCIINHYDRSFHYDEFNRIIDLMPWIVCMEFEGTTFKEYKEI